jgi:uncharacterized OB-fold protein
MAVQNVVMQQTVELVLVTCHNCAVVFGLPRQQYDHCKAYGDTFYCTHGHGAVFKESEVARLTRELAKKDQQLAAEKERTAAARDETAAAERRVSAQKARVTRLKNKAAKGECPCCGKLFVDLAEHMAAEHADFEQKADDEERP